MTISADATASQIRDALRSGTTTSREVCQGCLDRIAASNGFINAIIWQRASAAVLADADAADARVQGGTPLSDLDGVPFTLKAIHATAGARTTNCTSAIDRFPAADGDIAARLKAAGAILLGKTNVGFNPEQGKSDLFGETRNPKATGYATGGSSAGSCASVSANFAAFDDGADAAGSIRIPASFCGVYGLKATTGAISGYGDWSYLMPSRPPMGNETYAYGPVARSLDDLALILRTVAGPTAMSPQIAPLAPCTAAPLRKLVKVDHIGAWWTLSPFVQTKLDAVTAGLAASGVEIVCPAAPQIPWFDVTVFNTLYASLQNGPGAITGSYALNETPWAPSQLSFTGQIETQSQGRAYKIYLQRKLAELMGDADGLILGTTALSPRAFGSASDPDHWISYMAMTALFNITGNPAITIPAGTDPATGVPFGLQIVGRHHFDMDLIEHAKSVAACI